MQRYQLYTPLMNCGRQVLNSNKPPLPVNTYSKKPPKLIQKLTIYKV